MPFVIVLIVLFFIALIIGMPLATIWALNLLFGLVIPYTFKTWLAVVVLSAVIAPKPMTYKRD